MMNILVPGLQELEVTKQKIRVQEKFIFEQMADNSLTYPTYSAYLNLLAKYSDEYEKLYPIIKLYLRENRSQTDTNAFIFSISEKIVFTRLKYIRRASAIKDLVEQYKDSYPLLEGVI